MWKRWLSIPAALVLASCGPHLQPVNVVLVTIDTLRADRLGAMPNLEALARKGVVFENAVAQAPLTAPSHASILTGLNPTAHQVRDTGGFVLQPPHTTLAEMLQRQGWNTAAFVGAAVLKRQFGFDRGFAVYDDRMAKKTAGEYPGRRRWSIARRPCSPRNRASLSTC